MSLRARAARLAAALAAGISLAACDPASSGAAGATGEGAVALRRVIAAERSVEFTGVKLSRSGEDGATRATQMTVSRYAGGRTLLEWNGPAGATQRWSYRSRFAWIDDPELLLRNYTVALDPAAGAPVAARPTRRITVRADRPGRPSLELLVDCETWIVLQEEVRDAEGRPWLTSAFESIDFGKPGDPEAVATAEPLADPHDAGAGVVLPLAPTVVPAGFVRVGGLAGSDGLRRGDWSDGLAAFSILERPADAPPPGAAKPPGRGAGEVERRRRNGNVSLSGTLGGVVVTVTGNLPAEELEAVVRGLSQSR